MLLGHPLLLLQNDLLLLVCLPLFEEGVDRTAGLSR
jgi:hypothetical protein